MKVSMTKCEVMYFVTKNEERQYRVMEGEWLRKQLIRQTQFYALSMEE